jgi:hypothetical protein
VVEVLRQPDYADDVAIVALAVTVLRNLACVSTAGATAAADDGTATVEEEAAAGPSPALAIALCGAAAELEAAMEKFPHAANVQENGRCALYNLLLLSATDARTVLDRADALQAEASALRLEVAALRAASARHAHASLSVAVSGAATDATASPQAAASRASRDGRLSGIHHDRRTSGPGSTTTHSRSGSTADGSDPLLVRPTVEVPAASNATTPAASSVGGGNSGSAAYVHAGARHSLQAAGSLSSHTDSQPPPLPSAQRRSLPTSSTPLGSLFSSSRRLSGRIAVHPMSLSHTPLPSTHGGDGVGAVVVDVHPSAGGHAASTSPPPSRLSIPEHAAVPWHEVSVPRPPGETMRLRLQVMWLRIAIVVLVVAVVVLAAVLGVRAS